MQTEGGGYVEKRDPDYLQIGVWVSHHRQLGTFGTTSGMSSVFRILQYYAPALCKL